MTARLFPVFICLNLLGIVQLSDLSAASSKPSRPNIIFILADDYGTGEVGCYGADNYKTPHIDALAAGGMRFTRAYTAPLCGPSRALILTGRYPFRTGATNQDATGRMTPDRETMMPKILKQSGYVTSCVGKWGQLPLGPAEFGFDDYLKFKGSGAYWNSQPKANAYEVNGKSIKLRDGEYLPDVMHDHVARFITANRDKPFYLYYPLSHVHGEILHTPDSAPGTKDHYADNVTYMDKLVGKLTGLLDQLQLRDNTLIVFFGDNGSATGRAKRATIGGKALLGAKGSMQEGGSLVPLIVNWQGMTPAGSVSHDLVDATDFVPTFAELAGARLPEKTVIDGHSFLLQIKGEKGTPRDWTFNQLADMWYAREASWKLNQAGELYDMSDAPFAEKQVPLDSNDPAALAARARLHAVLAKLDPAGGIVDDGDGTGRHTNRKKEKANK
jgi:arylsulfatase A